MAPNRKNVASLELPISAEALQNLVQSKFLPLTDPSEPAQCEQQQQQQQVQRQRQSAAAVVEESASYWDWPADTQEEEKVEDLFSTAHIEANLIRDGKVYESSSNSNQVAAHDEYWAENATPDVAVVVRSTVPQHEADAYWSWPANRNLHNEQVAKHLTSGNHIVANLQKEAAEASAWPSSPRNSQNDSYWTWSADSQRQQQRSLQEQSESYWTWNTLSKEEEKQQLIQSILQYEEARQLLTADHIEKQLVAAASAAIVDQKESVVAAPTSSSGYWDW